jgi:hypothetical protein
MILQQELFESKSTPWILLSEYANCSGKAMRSKLTKLADQSIRLSVCVPQVGCALRLRATLCTLRFDRLSGIRTFSERPHESFHWHSGFSGNDAADGR